MVIEEHKDLEEWRALEAQWHEEDLWFEDWYDSVMDGANEQEPGNFPVCGLCGKQLPIFWPRCEFVEVDGMWHCWDCIRALDAAKKCEDLGIEYCPDFPYCPMCKSSHVWYGIKHGCDGMGSPEHYHCRECGFSFC
jgi:hypothetical protein